MCIFVALSAFGHMITVYISHSRALRECGRQGVLPFPRLWTSVKPFGTPLFPLLVTFIVNCVVLLAPPPGDAYNFIVDCGSYSGYIFNVLLAIGLFRVRAARKKQGLGYREFHIPTPLLVIVLLWYIFVLAMAFVPPKGSLIGSDISFFYAAYPITTIGLVLLCVAYFVVWAKILPRFGGYQHRIGEYTLPNGEKGHTVVKVKNADVEQWDTEHGHVKGGLSGAGFDDDEVASEVHLIANHTNSSNNSDELYKQNEKVVVKT
ncbi:unnamed protein product [Ambrosiozyma monospora]|uniref:Unnamed protein product n=1 Tax=Ambrosiozyma monospora TaxID=43982 RepID=A0ACB5TDJ5_AMBMO|nr:unnamed protein product [Ambrosiozyma monospora]